LSSCSWIVFFFLILVLKQLVIKARDTNCVVVLVGSKWPVWLRRKLTRSRWPFERGKRLKETRSLWPPQRGLGSLEPNLGKTNHRVIRFIFLVDLFFPSLPNSDFILTLTPAWSVLKVCKFQFPPIHPPLGDFQLRMRFSTALGEVERPPFSWT
jgi:hypothetical protein